MKPIKTELSFEEKLQALKDQNPSVTLIELSMGQGIGNKKAKIMAEAIAINTIINKFRLYRCDNVKEEGWIALAKAFETHRTIKELSLQQTELGNEEGCRALSEAFEKNTSLNRVQLVQVWAGIDNLKLLCEGLSRSRSIKSLNILSSTVYGNTYPSYEQAFEQSKAVSIILRNSISLARLRTNFAVGRGVEEISEALKANNIIKELELIQDGYHEHSGYPGNEEDGNIGARALADALEVNRSITDLTLEIPIGNKGVEYLSKSLRENNVIRKIKINSGHITNEGIEKILNALKDQNCRVCEFEFYERNISPELVEEVKKQLIINEGKPFRSEVGYGGEIRVLSDKKISKPARQQKDNSDSTLRRAEQETLQELQDSLRQQQELVSVFSSELSRLTKNQELLHQNQQTNSSAIINPKYHITAQDLAEHNYIATDPKLISYSNTIRENLNKAFFVANAVSSGKISLEQGKVGKAVGMLNKLGSGTPIGASLFSAISLVVDQVGSTRRAGRYSNFSDLVASADPVEIAAFVEKLACRMTITNEANIRNSSAQSKRNISNELNGFFRDQVSQVSDSFAKGLFSERKTEEELLAHKNSKDIMEYVLTGRLGSDLEEQNKQVSKPSLAITTQEIKAKEQDQIITTIVEEITKLQEIRLPISTLPKLSPAKETLKDQLEAATARRRKEVEKQIEQSDSNSSEKKLDGLTRKDVEDIIKQVTGGLNIEMIEFLKRRFEEDLYRGKQTSKKAAGHQRSLVEEIVNILAGKESDGLVKPSEVLSAKSESNDDNNSNSISDISNFPSTRVANTKISELERRNAELEKKLEKQSREQEEQNKKFAEFISEQRSKQNQNNNGGCCTIS